MSAEPTASRDVRPRTTTVWMLAAAILACALAVVVAMVGGFRVDIGLVRLSARTPSRVLFVAAMAFFGAVLSAERGRRTASIRDALALINERVGSALRSFPRITTVAVAVTVVVCALYFGSRVAGGSDSYGYVSQARMWAKGMLREPVPLMGEVDWPYAREALTPLGYRPALAENAMVPAYSAGLPLVMAVFEVVFGPGAVFWVVPLCGGLAILATYRLAVTLAGREAALASSVWLGTSPIFLHQLITAPMSDIPTTAWWMVSLALMTFDRKGQALLSGCFAGLAIVTRPNLAPLLAIGAGYYVWRSIARRGHVWHLALFLAGAAPALGLVAFLNTFWFGSPLMSGYGHVATYFNVSNVGPNAWRHLRWLVDAHTPALLLALPGAFWLAKRLKTPHVAGLPTAVSLFALGVASSYLALEVFESWTYSRFLLPALPFLIISATSAIWQLLSRWLPGTGAVALAFGLIIVATHGLTFSRTRHVFELKLAELRYSAIADLAAAKLPERAVLVAEEHSGSARHHAARPTIRFNEIPPTDLDRVLANLGALGYVPYFLLEQWEEPLFRDRFGGASAAGKLDWTPILEWNQSCCVRVYEAPGAQAR